jgi:hypothetical protein
MKDIKWTIDKEVMFDLKTTLYRLKLENIELSIYKRFRDKLLKLEISRMPDHVVMWNMEVEQELRYAKTRILNEAIKYLNKKIISYNKDLREIAPIL